MQKKFGVIIHNVGETTQFFKSQKQSNIGQFTHLKKEFKHIIWANLHKCIFGGDICYTYQFSDDQ
jgi:hypothetical protein